MDKENPILKQGAPGANLFDVDKKNVVGSLLFSVEEGRDKSRAGCVDRDIQDFVRTVNERANLYTTSSCAGRCIITRSKAGSKSYNVEWLSVSHDAAGPDAPTADGFFQSVRAVCGDAAADANVETDDNGSANEDGDDEIWFKLDPPLVAVCARSVKDGQALLNWCRGAGLKRASIVAIKQDGRPLLMISDTQRVETLIARNGKLLVDEAYLALLLRVALRKLRKSRLRFDQLNNLLAKKE